MFHCDLRRYALAERHKQTAPGQTVGDGREGVARRHPLSRRSRGIRGSPARPRPTSLLQEAQTELGEQAGQLRVLDPQRRGG
jgi:hypothetical protein